MAKIWLLLFNSSVIISHLGRNPVSGGRPPMDSKIRDVRGSVTGALFHRSEVVLIDEREWGERIEKRASVNIM